MTENAVVYLSGSRSGACDRVSRNPTVRTCATTVPRYDDAYRSKLLRPVERSAVANPCGTCSTPAARPAPSRVQCTCTQRTVVAPPGRPRVDRFVSFVTADARVRHVGGTGKHGPIGHHSTLLETCRARRLVSQKCAQHRVLSAVSHAHHCLRWKSSTEVASAKMLGSAQLGSAAFTARRSQLGSARRTLSPPCEPRSASERSSGASGRQSSCSTPAVEHTRIRSMRL